MELVWPGEEAKGDLMATYKHLMWESREDRAKLFRGAE